MNFETIKQLLIDISLNKPDWIDEYIDICSISSISNEYCEFHHILPVSLFPEYKKESWNIVRLTYKTHREAHRLLSYSGKLAMIKAYSIMQSNRVENINPAKLPEVREKISKSKLGIPRNDMKGKKYFGASEDRARQGIIQMSMKLKGTIVVRDSNNNLFRVSVDDERLKSGELTPHNRGQARPNAIFKTSPETVKRVIDNRTKLYADIASDYERLVTHLVSSCLSGKQIFGKHPGKFATNYARIVTMSKFDYVEVYNDVVQRLSNDTSSEVNLVE